MIKNTFTHIINTASKIITGIDFHFFVLKFFIKLWKNCGKINEMKISIQLFNGENYFVIIINKMTLFH